MRILFCMLVLLLCARAQAQQAYVEGIVRDKFSGQALSGASIGITGSALNEASDEFGRFILQHIKPGKYELIVSSIGYLTQKLPLEVKDRDRTALTVLLQPSALDLSAVTVTGRRSSNLSTIAAIDIKLRPITSSQDILRNVPGLFIAQHAGGGKADQLFLRGYDVDHGTDVAISVDGMPVNMVSHAHGQGYADLHFVIPELVQKLDFDKGPYSISKGDFATAGWVDFSTKDFLSDHSVKLEGGQFGFKRAAALFKLWDRQKEEDHQQVYIGSEYFLTDSYFDAPQDFHRLNLVGRYTGLLNRNARLSVSASTFDSKWNASGQIPERAVCSGMISRFGSIDDSEGGRTSRTNFNARFSKLWASGWKTTDQVYYSDYRFNLYSNFTFYLNDPVNGDEIQQKEHRRLWGYQGSSSKEYFIGRKRNLTEIGYGVRQDRIGDLQLNHVAKRQFLNSIAKGEVREWSSFLYLNQEISVGERFQLSMGVRADHFNFGYKNELLGETGFRHKSKTAFSPKLVLSFTPSSILKISFSNGIGFHSNDARVILYDRAKDILPAVYGTDLSFLLKPFRSLLLKTTFWHLFSQQEFVYVGDEGVVEPSGRTRRLGIDFSGRYQAFSWLYLDIDLNLARPRAVDEAKGQDYVPLAPVFTSIGGISIRTKKGLNASMRYRQMSGRPANEDNSVRAQGYFITDLVVNYSIGKLELFGSLENLFNSEWREAQFDTGSRLFAEPAPVSEIHYTPGTPRFFRAGVAVRW